MVILSESSGVNDDEDAILQQPDVAQCDSSRVWQQLPPELAERIVRFLPPNEVACTIRTLSKAAASQFRSQQYTIVRLIYPVPEHAFLHHWSRPDATRSLTLKQCRQLLRLTAHSGCIPNLKVVLDRLGCPFTTSLLVAAAAAGQQETCQWLQLHGCRWSEGVMRAAAATGCVEFCQWLVTVGCPFDERALAAAAGAGHRKLCEWLVSCGCTWRCTVPRAAAEGGHVALLDWLLQQRPERAGDEGLILAAVAAGCDLPTLQRLHVGLLDGPSRDLPAHMELRIITAAICSRTPDWQAKVEWLLAGGYPLAIDSWDRAAQRPDWMERLEWLQRLGLQPDVRAIVAAARAGNLDAMQYLLSQGIQVARYEATLVREAVRSGRLAVLQALHSEGCTLDGCGPVQQAAARGHMEVIVWLAETLGSGMRLSEEAATAAAGSGSMELLVWLHGQGCPFDEHTFAAAAEWGSEEMLEWLAANGCPMGCTGEPYLRAGRSGDLATLRCLRRLGCPWSAKGATFTRAVGQGCTLSVLQWLHEEGCPVNWAAAVKEARRPWRNEGTVLAWLQEQRLKAGGLMSCWWRRPAWYEQLVLTAAVHAAELRRMLWAP